MCWDTSESSQGILFHSGLLGLLFLWQRSFRLQISLLFEHPLKILFLSNLGFHHINIFFHFLTSLLHLPSFLNLLFYYLWLFYFTFRNLNFVLKRRSNPIYVQMLYSSDIFKTCSKNYFVILRIYLLIFICVCFKLF